MGCSPWGLEESDMTELRHFHFSLSCPLPGDLPDPGIKPMSLTSLALAGRFFTTSITGKPKICILILYSLVLLNSSLVLKLLLWIV